jgi:hypothetical protein
LAITPNALKFTSEVFEFDLKDGFKFIEEKYSDPEIDDKMRTGIAKFLDCLNPYLDQMPNITSVDESRVKIYSSVTLENGAIIRATSSYFNKPWFSNVSVHMNPDESLEYISDEGICYGQVID